MRTLLDIPTYLKTAVPQGHKADGQTLYACPICYGNRKLEVNWPQRVWYCHKCGMGGRLEGAKHASVGPSVRKRPVWSFKPTARGSVRWNYLSRVRGFSERQIEDLRPHDGPDPLRVYFPIYGLGSNTPIYWVGRKILETSSGPPYIEPPMQEGGVRKTDVLWGLHRLQVPIGHIVVVEGIFDAVWEENRLALLGKKLSWPQTEILQKISPEEITLMLDGDAIRDALKMVRRLSSVRVPLYIVELPLGVDPDGLREKTKEWLPRRRRVA